MGVGRPAPGAALDGPYMGMYNGPMNTYPKITRQTTEDEARDGLVARLNGGEPTTCRTNGLGETFITFADGTNFVVGLLGFGGPR